MMKFTVGFKSFKIAALSVLAVGLFLFISVPAYAISLPSRSDVHTAVDQAQTNVDQFFQQSQQALSQKIDETRTVLKNLPDNLEKSTAEFDAAHRQRVLADLQATQQKLQATAQSYEQYAQQADALEQEALYSAQQSRSNLKTGTQQKLADVKESFKLTADALNVLADDTKQAINDTTAFSKSRFNKHTQAVQQALDTSDKALKTLFN